MRTNWVYFLPLFIVIACSPVTSVPGPERSDIDRLTGRVISAYGGVDALKQINSVSARGTISTFMSGDSGTYSRAFRRDRKLRVETVYQRSAETRILNGSSGYRSTGNAPLLPVSGAPHMAMVYQFKYLDMPFSFLHGGQRMVNEGEAQIEGRTVTIVKIDDPEGPPMKLCIDKSDHKIIRAVGYFTAAGRNVDLTADFSDFRNVNGVIMPFKITNYSGGMKISETVINKYAFDDIPDGLFLPDQLR